MMKLINLTSLGGACAPEELHPRLSPEPAPGCGVGAPSRPSPEESRGGTENNSKIGGRWGGMSFPREVLLVFSSEKLSKYIKCDTKSYIIHFFMFLHQKLTLEL